MTRRLYRSGESEYLLDGEICRLRDVHEFLMDTGLGAKAYAIIEQGKIGMILSTRPADRRQLIEEAAGITKYKARRRTAELKLEAAQLNLTRLDDIIFELEKQFGSLKRQSAKARRYRRLREELRHWEKCCSRAAIARRRRRSRSIRARLADAHGSAKRPAAAGVAAADADFSRVRLSLVGADDARDSRARSRARVRARHQHAASSRLNSTGSRSTPSSVRATDVRSELDSLEARREPSRVAVAERQVATSKARQDQQAAAADLEHVETEYGEENRRIEGLEADVEAARSEVFSALNVATTLRHAIQHAEEAGARVAQELAKLAIEEGDVRMEKDRLDDDRAATADGLRRAQQAAEASMHSRTARETELATSRIELEWKSNNLQARERELAGLTARLASLTELEEARAGYTEAAAHGACAGQRARRPAGIGRRLS